MRLAANKDGLRLTDELCAQIAESLSNLANFNQVLGTPGDVNVICGQFNSDRSYFRFATSGDIPPCADSALCINKGLLEDDCIIDGLHCRQSEYSSSLLFSYDIDNTDGRQQL